MEAHDQAQFARGEANPGRYNDPGRYGLPVTDVGGVAAVEAAFARVLKGRRPWRERFPGFWLGREEQAGQGQEAAVAQAGAAAAGAPAAAAANPRRRRSSRKVGARGCGP